LAPVRQLLLTALIVTSTIVQAQQEITVKGIVAGGDGEHTFYDLMIVNRRTRSGTFANTDGSFSTRALSTDTLLVGAGGYVTRTVDAIRGA